MRKTLLFLLVAVLCSCSSKKSTININNNTMTNTTQKVNKKFEEQIVVSGKNKVNISVLLPLEGENADISQIIVNAIQLSYYNNNNSSIFIRFYTTFSKGKNVVVQAAKDAVDGGADIIIGPLFSNNVEKVAEIAKRKNITVISFANDRSSIFNTDNVYLAGYSPEVEVERIVDYMVTSKQASKFVAIVPENQYGKLVLSALEAALKARGLELIRYSSYDPNTINFSKTIESIIDPETLSNYKEAITNYNDINANNSRKSLFSAKDYPQLELDFDTLFVADSGLKVILLGSHLPYVGISSSKINLISTRIASSAKLYNEPIFNNMKLPDFVDLQNTIFASKFSSVFKQKPNLIAAAAYDIVQMIVNMVTVDPKTNIAHYDFSKENLNNKHISGVLGSYIIREDGMIQRHMEVNEVVNKSGYRTVKDSNVTDDNFMKVPNYKDVPLYDFKVNKSN